MINFLCSLCNSDPLEINKLANYIETIKLKNNSEIPFDLREYAGRILKHVESEKDIMEEKTKCDNCNLDVNFIDFLTYTFNEIDKKEEFTTRTPQDRLEEVKNSILKTNILNKLKKNPILSKDLKYSQEFDILRDLLLENKVTEYTSYEGHITWELKKSTNDKYLKRVWLNKEGSPSTGSVVAYRGEMTFENGTHRTAFLEVADCHNKVRLHVTPMDTMHDFILKMETLKDVISEFIIFLKHEDRERV